MLALTMIMTYSDMRDTYFRIPDFGPAVERLKRDHTYLKLFFVVAFIATCAAVAHNPKALMLTLMMLPMLALGIMHISIGRNLKGYDEGDDHT